jgi:hypothetical protein
VPEETARVARAAFPAGTLYLRMRDAVDTLYQGSSCRRCSPSVASQLRRLGGWRW